MTDTVDHVGAYHPTPLPTGRATRWLVPNTGGIVALLLLIPALAANVPFTAWLIAAGMWLLNRLGHAAVLRFVDGLPKAMAVGAAGFGMMLRVWTIAFVLFFVGASLDVGETSIGLGRRDLAVPAMLLFMVIFTFDVMARSLFELRRYKLGAADPASAEAAGGGEEETPA